MDLNQDTFERIVDSLYSSKQAGRNRLTIG
jgi:hypothetical protein